MFMIVVLDFLCTITSYSVPAIGIGTCLRTLTQFLDLGWLRLRVASEAHLNSHNSQNRSYLAAPHCSLRTMSVTDETKAVASEAATVTDEAETAKEVEKAAMGGDASSAPK